MTKILKNKIVYEQEINGLNGKANLIVYPESLEEVKAVVNTYKDIIPRGYGTSFTGAVHPNKSVIVDLSKSNRVLEINTNKRLVYVETGITLKELNEQLEEYSLEFPVETIFSGVETLGGILAKNSAGIRELKYGKAMAWVDSLEIVNSSGELVKIRKSDLSEHVGMEGTTGIILRATLRLTPLKSRSISILKSDSLENIFDANRKLRIEQEVCAVDLINKQISTLLGMENKYHLFVEFEGDKGNFKGQEYTRFYKLKSKVYNKIAQEGYPQIENIKSFSDGVADIISYLEEKKIPYFSNLASGFFYCFFKNEEKDKRKNFLDFAKKLRTKIAYNFGIGLTRKEFLDHSEKEIISRVKKRVDPNFKFNNNKLIDTIKHKDLKEDAAEEVEDEIEEHLLEEEEEDEDDN